MLAHPSHYQAGGANSYPAIPEGGDAGYETTIITSDVTFGTIVTTGYTDADALLDSGATDGARSPLQVCEVAGGTGTPDKRAALYGCVQEPGGIKQGEKGRVASGFVTIKARVELPSGSSVALLDLMDDPATPGRLITWDGTGKCIAKLAHKVESASAGESLQWVHFQGIYSFAGALV